MTLPSSGTLTYNTIRAEFGSSSSNVYLSLYIRGSSYTPNIPPNSNITTGATSAIAVNDFYGASTSDTDYAWGTGGAHNTGGKSPAQYYGIGGPSLPSFNKATCKVGTATTTMSAYYYSDGGGAFGSGSGHHMTFANSNGYQNSNWTSRTFTTYDNTASGVIGTFTTSSVAGGTRNVTWPSNSGVYVASFDNMQVLFANNEGANPAETYSAITGNMSSGLNQYFSVKAF